MLKRLLLLAIPLVIAAPAQARKAKPVMRHATGTFEVTLTPEAQDGDAARFGLVKTFSGAMQGTAKGVMISLGTPSPARLHPMSLWTGLKDAWTERQGASCWFIAVSCPRRGRRTCLW
jgi:hypothetical protein